MESRITHKKDESMENAKVIVGFGLDKTDLVTGPCAAELSKEKMNWMSLWREGLSNSVASSGLIYV